MRNELGSSIGDALKVFLPSGGAIGVITIGDLQAYVAIAVGVVGIACSTWLTIKKVKLINRQLDDYDRKRDSN